MKLIFNYKGVHKVDLDKNARYRFKNRFWYVLKEIEGSRVCLAGPLVYHRELSRHAGWSDFSEWFQAIVIKDDKIVDVIPVEYD